jgi:hypothetical protein
MNRVGIVDDLNEGFIRQPLPPNSGTIGAAHEHIGPTRQARVNQRGARRRRSGGGPGGGALTGPSATPHLPVVGARNPVAVPRLTR